MTHAAAGRELQSATCARTDARSRCSASSITAVLRGRGRGLPAVGRAPRAARPLHVCRRRSGDRVHDRRCRVADVPRLRRHGAMIRARSSSGSAPRCSRRLVGRCARRVHGRGRRPAERQLRECDRAHRRDGHPLGRHERRRDVAARRGHHGRRAAGGASVWYSWTAPLEGEVEIDTVGSDFDTLIGVYTGNAVGSLTEVASNDDFIHPPASRVRFHGTLGSRLPDQGRRLPGRHGLDPPAGPSGAPPRERRLRRRDRPQLAGRVPHGDTNDGATLETDEADSVADADAGASVWYEWTAPVDRRRRARHGDEHLRHAARRLHGKRRRTHSPRWRATTTRRFLRRASSGSRRRPEPIYRIRVDGFAATTGTINLHLHEVAARTRAGERRFRERHPAERHDRVAERRHECRRNAGRRRVADDRRRSRERLGLVHVDGACDGQR